MKSAKQHVVPLSTAALAVLDRQQSVRARRCSVSQPAGSPLSYASFATGAGKGLEFAEVDTFGSPRHRDDRSELPALPSAAFSNT